MGILVLYGVAAERLCSSAILWVGPNVAIKDEQRGTVRGYLDGDEPKTYK
jgi:hypothetical protein